MIFWMYENQDFTLRYTIDGLEVMTWPDLQLMNPKQYFVLRHGN